MTAPTRGTTDKNEKSTMLEEHGPINTDFFPLLLPIPISPESCLHFFTEAVKKGASSCVLGRYHIHAYKSAEPPGGAVAGSTANGSPVGLSPGTKNRQDCSISPRWGEAELHVKSGQVPEGI